MHLYGNNWSALPPAVFKACFHHLFLGVFLFIYLEPLPPSTGFYNVRERERREFCYLSGIVISRALPLWLESAPVEPTAEWTISCSPLEGKSWFLFPSLPPQPPKPIVLSLPICLSISLTSYLSFIFWPHFILSTLIFSYFHFCLSLHNFDLLWTTLPNFQFHNILLTGYRFFSVLPLFCNESGDTDRKRLYGMCFSHSASATVLWHTSVKKPCFLYIRNKRHKSQRLRSFRNLMQWKSSVFVI